MSSRFSLGEVLGMLLMLSGIAGLFVTIYRGFNDDRQRKEERRVGSCQDEAALLATTTGNPNSFQCPNLKHTMHVETKMIGAEEVGVVVFCECKRDEK